MNNLLTFAQTTTDGSTAGAIFTIIFMLVMIGLVVCAIVFWIKMLVHAAKNDIADKALWILIILLGQLIGAIVYYYVVKKEFSSKPVKK